MARTFGFPTCKVVGDYSWQILLWRTGSFLWHWNGWRDTVWHLGTCAGLSACPNTPPPAEFPAAPWEEVGKPWCGEQRSWDAAGGSSSGPVVLQGAARAGSWLSSTGQRCWVLTASLEYYRSQRWVKWRKSGGLNSSSSCMIKVSLVLLPTCPSCSLQSRVNPRPQAGTSALPRRCSWLPS